MDALINTNTTGCSELTLPRDRKLIGQSHAIKRQALPSGKASFEAERSARGHADKYWAVALAHQKERATASPHAGEVGVRLLG